MSGSGNGPSLKSGGADVVEMGLRSANVTQATKGWRIVDRNLEKIYNLPDTNTFKRLVHIDAYRLKGGAELSALGFAELMKDLMDAASWRLSL